MAHTFSFQWMTRVWSWNLAIAAVSKSQSEIPVTQCKEAEEGDECGEDAFCVLETNTNAVLSIADGVGGWRRKGIDPSAFSKTLMEQVGQTACGSTKAIEVIKRAFIGLVEAYERGQEEPFGSSTICVAALDRIRGRLDLANLGDSAAAVFRDGCIALTTARRQRGFNRPVQLALEPTGLAKGNLKDAEHSQLQLKHGDCLIMATDGLWDNLFMDQITERLHRHTKNSVVDEESLAIDLCETARMTSLWPYEENTTPFSLESSKAGIKHQGGKRDDITVIVAQMHL